MKGLDRLYLLVLLFLCTTTAGEALLQTNLDLRFGLESAQHYVEQKTTRAGSAALRAQPRKDERLYRFFTTDQSWPETIAAISDRHFGLWQSLQKEAGTSQFSMDEDAYSKEIKKRDPYLLGMINDSAPRLYFDFAGHSGTEYILEAIEIRTIDFEEYRGGGFFNNEAWYDILLRHAPGVHVYNIDRRLRFTGSGRTVLRFWSDNWYPNVGMAPQGCYFIDITFVFRVNGKLERVTTGKFKIDV